MLKMGSTKRYISSGMRWSIQYYQSLLSNVLPLAPLIMYFSIKYRQNRLLLESCIELQG